MSRKSAIYSAQSLRKWREKASTRRREVVTPEGLSLSFTLASRMTRFGALVIDLLILIVSLSVFLGAMSFLILRYAEPVLRGHKWTPAEQNLLEVLVMIAIAGLFLLRYGWILWFELGARGATWGKRMLGIRVAARDGGRLSAEMVIARNLLRDIEVFLPVQLLFSLMGKESNPPLVYALAAWFALFLLFICFNRDGLRPGDLIAGTWVVEAPREKLKATMTQARAAATQGEMVTAYQFGEAELSVYGEYELQALERVLRSGSLATMQPVAATICGKIGWSAPTGHEVRPFLDAFYSQLRARLERGMRMGQRKSDKFD
jgi:uncharacterized RDD family membrane protein YckC